MADTERSEGLVLCENGTLGQIKIADDVIAVIAALAATEVEGVDSMAGNITHELVRKLGMKNLQKGVKIELLGEEVSCALSLNVAYGYSIPEVCENVQEKVKTTIENMTGLHVTDVNVNIAGVNTNVNR